ncbi:MAG TPA: OmpH family outer membrane protein [Pirellulaceae bacterium]|nr:OmpH family outer membrane protein [Pirellulaceae bacterium]
MKLRLLLVLVGCILGAAAVAPGQTTLSRGTIAFANYEAIFNGYFKTLLANDQLQDLLESINRERANLLARYDALHAELQTLRDRLLEESPPPTPADTDTLRRQLDTKTLELRRLEERVNTFNETQARRWDDQARRVRTTLMAEINEKIGEHMKNRGYLAVFDLSQTNQLGVAAVLHVDPRADITQDLINEINR